jgi:hypothetical protein
VNDADARVYASPASLTPTNEEMPGTMLDKLKGLFKGKSKQVNKGIDQASKAVQDKVPDAHDDKVAKVADEAKKVVDKLEES